MVRMLSLGLGLNEWLAMNNASSGGGAPTLVTRLATRNRHNGAAALTSNGATGAYDSGTALINESGAPITIARLVNVGWSKAVAGYQAALGNNVPITAIIQYPSGTTVGTFQWGGSNNGVIPDGGQLVSDAVTLSTPIPSGATFKVIISTTLTNGQKYFANFGFIGVLTTAMSDTIKKAYMSIGDSIMTGSSGGTGPLFVAALNRLPLINISIASAEINRQVGFFNREVALATACGSSGFISNFGTNDITNAGRTLAQIQADFATIKAQAAAANLKFYQATLLPKTAVLGTYTTPNVTATSGVFASGIVTLTVPDATKFSVNRFYTVSGAAQSGYNGRVFLTAVDTNLNTISYRIPTTPTTPATGTIVISRLRDNSGTDVGRWATRNDQVPFTGFEAGSSSIRGLFNAWVRSGYFDGILEWGDAVELARNDGLWGTGEEMSNAIYGQRISNSVLAVTSQTQFTCTTNLTVNDKYSAGYLVWTSGNNIGQCHYITQKNNAGGGITLLDVTANGTIVAGDTFDIIPQGYIASTDGIHPYRFNVNGGGSITALEEVSKPFLTALAA